MVNNSYEYKDRQRRTVSRNDDGGKLMSESPRLKVIVAMPAHNEGKYIGSIVLQAKQYAGEVIVIDDGSTDSTSNVARLAGATVIKHGGTKGKGVASQRTPDVLILLDADSQHNPEEIPSFIKAISEGFDLVIGSRKIRRYNIPLYRKVGQKVLIYFTNILSRRKLSDTESGFRALSRKAISKMQPKESGFSIEAEMISEASAKGLKITEVPISAIYTKDGSTLNPVRHGFGVLNRIMVMISEKRPLLFFSLCGGILIVVGLVAGVSIVQTYLISQVLATGTALISVLFITIGILSIFTGVILNVLVKRING
jgi:glycosyltransferase involved in cell wall biosynthesis